jgi:PAS domain-containing protein
MKEVNQVPEISTLSSDAMTDIPPIQSLVRRSSRRRGARPARIRQVAQRPVELILARQLASSMAVPVLLIDASGDTLFFNEPAESIFARRFDEIEALGFEERTAVLAPRRDDGGPLPVGELPGMVAMRDRRPAHAALYIHGFDGVLRPVQATAVPLESASAQVLGALVVLWSRSDPSRTSPAAT